LFIFFHLRFKIVGDDCELTRKVAEALMNIPDRKMNIPDRKTNIPAGKRRREKQMFLSHKHKQL
jgi:hypothetical protein